MSLTKLSLSEMPAAASKVDWRWEDEVS